MDQLLLLVGSIDGKMDLMLEQQRHHATRISVLERDRNRLTGGIAALTGIITWIAKDSVIPHLATLFH